MFLTVRIFLKYFSWMGRNWKLCFSYSFRTFIRKWLGVSYRQWGWRKARK